MVNQNVEGYKIIFFTENLMREFIEKYLSIDLLPITLVEEAKKNAENNDVDPNDLSYFDILNYLHIGQLYDLIKSKVFVAIHPNQINLQNITPLIKKRNTIMHSRYISAEQYEEIKEICEKIIGSFNDLEFQRKWNKFITEEIAEFQVPLIFVEYPLGKNFERLIGRDDELKRLKRAIKIPTPVSIIRHGGLGKTALVLQLVEDLLYTSGNPFEQIYFMSFKNSVFENGTVKKLEKVISNHTDLINRLAHYMNIKEIDSKPFSVIEEEVWNNIFSKRTLLVLDNLETEIVQSNLSEFAEIANRFMSNYTNPSRLIITSRYGLGDREQKFPIFEFDITRTMDLVKMNMVGKEEKLKRVSDEDWDWVQTYTKGNPGLIISFSNTFKSSPKTLMDLRVEFNTKYTMESRELHDAQDAFLEFCFENTVESLPTESQLFLSVLSYLSSEADLKEISEELLVFLIDELNFEKSMIHNLRASVFINIGFLQPIFGSNKYYINEMFIDYINGNFADDSKIITVFDLQNMSFFPKLKQMRSNILDLTDEKDLSVGQLLSKLYQLKYRNNSDKSALLKAFICDPTIENLVYYYEKAEFVDILNNFNLMDKLKSLLLQNKQYDLQERITKRIIFAITNINHQIKSGQLRRFRQNDLYDYFKQLKNRLSIFRTDSISHHLRGKVIDMLVAINYLDEAETYLVHYEDSLFKNAFELYSRQLGNLAGKDVEKCERYIVKCNGILLSKNGDKIRGEAKALYFVYLSRYYRNNEQYNLAIKTASELDTLPKNSDTMYSLYLETLLIRAQCHINHRGMYSEAERFVNEFKDLSGNSRYSNLRPRKRQNLDSAYRRLERSLKASKK
ncbi:hypothetical protein [Brevibacillus panacihumi]|uniref:hypothetical protein n=1 Tax=Brevibacillus panacihumi TaxID=497735 RepID=UPI003D2330EC